MPKILAMFFPTLNKNLMLILCSEYLSWFLWRAIQTLLQLKHNSSALTRLVKISVLLCRIQTCTFSSTNHWTQSDSCIAELPVSLFFSPHICLGSDLLRTQQDTAVYTSFSLIQYYKTQNQIWMQSHYELNLKSKSTKIQMPLNYRMG